MNFAISILAAVAIVMMTTAVVIWPRRHTAHWVVSFLGLAGGVTIWLVGYALELSVPGLQDKIFWAQVEYIGIAFTPVGWFLFAYHFLTQNTRNLKPLLLILSIIPFLTIVIAFTNSQHHLLWTQNMLDESGMMVNSYGGWFWIHSVYCYLLIIGGIGLFLRTLKLHPRPFRWQSMILVISAALPLLGNALYLADLSPIPQFDITPFAFAISALLISWGVARMDLFDIIPIARRKVIESLPDSIVLLDMKNRILDVNETGQKLLDPSGERVVGRQLSELDIPIAEKVLSFNEMEVDEEFLLRERDGTRCYSIQIRPFHISDSYPLARILILRDISRRYAAEEGIRQRNLELQQLITEAQTARETAEEANKAKSDLLAKVSHELRTPLSAILGHAEMLQEGVYGEVNDKQNHSLNRIIENSEYLNDQVKDLLDISRVGTETLEVELHPFNLAHALEHVIDRVKSDAEKKGLEISLLIAPTVPQQITSNALRLQQILINLSNNAIKFTERGCVHLSAEMINEEQLCLKVSDTGLGIPQNELGNIFQPFYQLGQSMVRGQGGVGLGLAIAKELVAILNGKLEVESQVGKGSTFCLILPLTPIKEVERDKNVNV